MTILDDLARWRPEDRETRMTAQWWMVDPLRELGRVDEADARLGEVLTEYAGIYGGNNARYLWARTSLGNLRILQRRFDEAEAVLLVVEQRIRSSLGDSHNIGLSATYFRGVLRLREGRVAEALPLPDESYRLRKRYQGEDSHSTWLAANRLAQALSKLGQIGPAGQVLDPAYESAVRSVGLDHPYSIRLASTRAQHLLLRGQVDAASEQLALALNMSMRACRHCTSLAPSCCTGRRRFGSAVAMPVEPGRNGWRLPQCCASLENCPLPKWPSVWRQRLRIPRKTGCNSRLCCRFSFGLHGAFSEPAHIRRCSQSAGSAGKAVTNRSSPAIGKQRSRLF